MAPSLHTVHLRRTALRLLFNAVRQVDPTVPDPTGELGLPGKGSRRARPLTDGEIDLLRTAALGRARQPLRGAAAVALAEATATTGEIPRVQWCDVDLDAGSVMLPGANPIGARPGRLTAWGIGLLRRWNETALCAPGAPVMAPRTNRGDPHSAQAATANLLTKLLSVAGVQGPGIRPGSIRLWGAATVLAVEGIEAAARALGVDSLDVASAALDHRWRIGQ